MDAKQLFDSGNLQGAISQLTADVKASPLELRNRIFLFELLCFAGDFQRAERQLDAVAQVSGDVKTELGVQMYRQILQAEDIRGKIIKGESRQPKFLFEPPSYTALHLQALTKLKDQHFDEMEALLNESSKLQKNLPGQIDNVPFEDFRDGDDLLAPFLEVFIQADYVWLPLEQVLRFEIQAPRTLRDLLWIPAKIELPEQPATDVFIPVRYCGSSGHPDDSVKLGRMTVWEPVGEEKNLGKGQRTFLIGGDERSLLEIRKIEFAAPQV
jgi:type VI secretion system protein ImpE